MNDKNWIIMVKDRKGDKWRIFLQHNPRKDEQDAESMIKFLLSRDSHTYAARKKRWKPNWFDMENRVRHWRKRKEKENA